MGSSARARATAVSLYRHVGISVSDRLHARGAAVDIRAQQLHASAHPQPDQPARQRPGATIVLGHSRSQALFATHAHGESIVLLFEFRQTDQRAVDGSKLPPKLKT